MSYKLDNLPQSAVTLTQSVVQATQMLGLYQAELARVLGVRCGEVGELFLGKRNFEPDTEVCVKALLFIQFYELLYDKLKGDDVAMFNWLRRKNTDLNGIPLLLMVDEGALENLIQYINSCS